jgi:hypothetical protein
MGGVATRGYWGVPVSGHPSGCGTGEYEGTYLRQKASVPKLRSIVLSSFFACAARTVSGAHE